MKLVQIISDGFMNGQTRYPKGSQIQLADPIARLVVKEGNGFIVGEAKEKPKPKPAPKRKASRKKYIRRDMQAEK